MDRDLVDDRCPRASDDFGHRTDISFSNRAEMASVHLDSGRMGLTKIDPDTSVKTGGRFRQKKVDSAMEVSHRLPMLRSDRHFKDQSIIIDLDQNEAERLQRRPRPHLLEIIDCSRLGRGRRLI